MPESGRRTRNATANFCGYAGVLATVLFLAFGASAKGAPVSSIATGSSHACVLLTNSRVDCWGRNNEGQLGNGTIINTERLHFPQHVFPHPVEVVGLSNAIAVSVGSGSCALLTTGNVECWGGNKVGQVGDGTTVERNTPVLVTGLSNAKTISSGWGYSCAVITNGEVKCWGYGVNGQLGDGTNTSSAVPVNVVGINNAVAVSAGLHNTCALLATEEVDCWGEHTGNDTSPSSLVPVRLTEGHIEAHGASNYEPLLIPFRHIVSLGAGGDDACATNNEGVLECWGSEEGVLSNELGAQGGLFPGQRGRS